MVSDEKGLGRNQKNGGLLLSERISKAPRPPSEVGGCGAIHEPKPTEVLSDLPVNYPRTLVVRTLVIIAEAVRKFSVQNETLELSKYVISELTPHFREACKIRCCDFVQGARS